MTAAHNIRRLGEFFEAFWKNGDGSAADAIIAKDAVFHRLEEEVAAGRLEAGTNPERAMRELVVGAFPDMVVEVEQLFGAGDLVAIGWTVTGTHLGHFGTLPPTGRRASVLCLGLSRMRDGQIVEGWQEIDRIGLARALGFLPPPGAPNRLGSVASSVVRLRDLRLRLPAPMPQSGPGMAEQSSAAARLAQRWVAATWDPSGLAAQGVLAPGSTMHQLPSPGTEQDAGSSAERLRNCARALRHAFPDAQPEVLHHMTDGSMVAVRWSVTGTHLGPFNGFPPTGRRVTGSGMAFLRTEGDRVADAWQLMDELGMAEALGLMPRMGPPAPVARLLVRRIRRRDRRAAAVQAAPAAG